MATDIVRIGRALLSVSDKTGLLDLARALKPFGVDFLSTGGTAAALNVGGFAVVDVTQITGFPEMMDGRVKTLHPRVHGGLLAIRAEPAHQAAMIVNDITPIDLLVVNLYRFEAAVKRDASFEERVENIDIGGPATRSKSPVPRGGHLPFRGTGGTPGRLSLGTGESSRQRNHFRHRYLAQHADARRETQPPDAGETRHR